MDDQPSSNSVLPAASDVSVTLCINGLDTRIDCDPRTTLLDALRDRAGLTGSKKGCDRGQCGACTVLLDDRRVVACLVFAVAAEGHRITTIEGIAQAPSGEVLQRAFVERDALQCGYCTPGQICSAVGMLDEAKQGWPSAVTDDLGEASDSVLEDNEIRERLSGNICRCGAYVNILAAVRSAAGDVVKAEESV